MTVDGIDMVRTLRSLNWYGAIPIQLSNSQGKARFRKAQLRALATAGVRVGAAKRALEIKRAQGRPGAGRTHGPPATKNAGGSHHRLSQIIRPSLRDGFNGYSALSPVTIAWLPPSSAKRFRGLSACFGAPGPHDFAVRVRHVRLTCHPRPPHPRPTYRDDRPKRPSSPRRDAREHRCDLPDEASAETCGRLARRAIFAWRVCAICPSGKISREQLVLLPSPRAAVGRGWGWGVAPHILFPKQAPSLPRHPPPPIRLRQMATPGQAPPRHARRAWREG